MLIQLLQHNKFSTKTKNLLFFVLSVCILFSNLSIVAQDKGYTVVLDAGHGGHEPGKVGINGYKEKDIALKIVLKIGEILKQKGRISKGDTIVNLGSMPIQKRHRTNMMKITVVD